MRAGSADLEVLDQAMQQGFSMRVGSADPGVLHQAIQQAFQSMGNSTPCLQRDC